MTKEDISISEKLAGTGAIGDGFEEEVDLVKEKQQRLPRTLGHLSLPGWGRVSLNDSESEGDKIGEPCWAQPQGVLKV